MNIYDEAIEKLRSVMAKFIIPNVEDSDYGCLYDRCHFYNSLDDEEEKWLDSVYKVLERAKKEHELFELLLKLDDCKNFAETRDFYETHSDDIQKLRKELETLK